MISAQISSWGFQLALRLFWEAGVFHDTLTAAEVPKGIGLPLNTSAFSLIAPAVAKKWPDMPMVLDLNVSAAPNVSFAGGAITLDVPTTFGFSVQPAGKLPAVPVFTLGCPLSVGANLSISNETFHIAFVFDKCHLTLVESSAGTVHSELLGAWVDLLMKVELVPGMNQAIAPGWSIPSIADVTLVNSKLTLQGAAVMVQTDLRWTNASLASPE
eukprot:SAG22_NODE_2438_length_2574_cov_2.578586_2_plen_214_part_00